MKRTFENGKFEWHKKRQAEEQKGLSREEQDRLDGERRLQNKLELDRIRQRREEREQETAAKQLTRDREQWNKELASLGNWEEKERLFHLAQSYQKVYLRIRERRAKNLHLLALNTMRIYLQKELCQILLLNEEKISEFIKNLNKKELEEILNEVDEYFLAFEKDKDVIVYWEALKIVVNELLELPLEKLSMNLSTKLVENEINSIFQQKTYDQLLILRKGIEEKLKDPEVDSDYWNNLLINLNSLLKFVKLDEAFEKITQNLSRDANSFDLKLVQFSIKEYFSGKLRFGTLGNDNDRRKEPIKSFVLIEENINWDNSPDALALLEFERNRSVGKDELPFNNEAEDIPKSEPNWIKDYPVLIPRKPRYFNRVRMNYEWNKYNQTHYDSTNPPPKVVQGFRFNVFYPHLVNSNCSPTYAIEKDPTSQDYRILRFISDAPYEDLMFRIPDEEWDVSSKHGFKCIFDKGALRLHFWFRSQRYRR